MLGISIAGFILTALLNLFVPVDTARWTPVLIGIMALATMLPLTRLLRSREAPDLFEIIYPVSVAYFIYFVLSPRNPITESGIYYPWLSTGDINRTLMYISLGYFLLLVGYYSPFSSFLARQVPQPRLSANPSRIRGLVYILFASGLTIRLILLAHGTHTWSVKLEEIDSGSFAPGWVTNLAYLNNLATLAYLMGATCYFSSARTRPFAFFFWSMLFPAECIWGFLQGSKSAFLPVLMAPFVAYNYLRRRATVRDLIVPVLAAVFLVFPIISTYREVAPEYPITLANLPKSVPKILPLLRSGVTDPDSDTNISKGPDLVAERASGLLPMANAVQYVLDNGVLYGETLRPIVVMLIPSFLLPNKYQLNFGATLYGEITGEFEGTSGIALMQAGEFYLNFGLLGLLIGMLLQGILYRVWQDYWIRFNEPLAVAMFCLGWRILVFIEQPFAVSYGELLREILLMAPILWLTTRGGPPGKSSLAEGTR